MINRFALAETHHLSLLLCQDQYDMWYVAAGLAIEVIFLISRRRR